MKSIIVLAATVACVYAQISLPQGYTEKYLNRYKFSPNARHRRGLAPQRVHSEHLAHLSKDRPEETDPMTYNKFDGDKNSKKDEDFVPLSIEMVVRGVETNLCPNVSTDHAKLESDETTESEDDRIIVFGNNKTLVYMNCNKNVLEIHLVTDDLLIKNHLRS